MGFGCDFNAAKQAIIPLHSGKGEIGRQGDHDRVKRGGSKIGAYERCRHGEMPVSKTAPNLARARVGSASRFKDSVTVEQLCESPLSQKDKIFRTCAIHARISAAIGGATRAGSRPRGCLTGGGRPQVVEAAWILSIAAAMAALKSSSDWPADKPSVSAREKLAIMPAFAARRALASSRL